MKIKDILKETIDTSYIQTELNQYYNEYRKRLREEVILPYQRKNLIQKNVDDQVFFMKIYLRELLIDILQKAFNSVLEDFVGGIEKDFDVDVIFYDQNLYMAQIIRENRKVQIKIPIEELSNIFSDKVKDRVWTKIIKSTAHEMVHAITHIKSKGKQQKKQTYKNVNDAMKDVKKYLQDDDEIEAWSSDAAYEIYYDLNKEYNNPVDKALSLIDSGSYDNLAEISNSFDVYYEYFGIYSKNSSQYPKKSRIWKNYLTKLYKKLKYFNI